MLKVMELSQDHNVIDIGKKYCPPSCLPCACLCLPEKSKKIMPVLQAITVLITD